MSRHGANTNLKVEAWCCIRRCCELETRRPPPALVAPLSAQTGWLNDMIGLL